MKVGEFSGLSITGDGVEVDGGIDFGLQFLVDVRIGHDVKHGRSELGGRVISSRDAVCASQYRELR